MAGCLSKINYSTKIQFTVSCKRTNNVGLFWSIRCLHMVWWDLVHFWRTVCFSVHRTASAKGLKIFCHVEQFRLFNPIPLFRVASQTDHNRDRLCSLIGKWHQQVCDHCIFLGQFDDTKHSEVFTIDMKRSNKVKSYEGPAKSFVTGFELLQCYVLSNIFLLQTFKVFPLYWNTFL